MFLESHIKMQFATLYRNLATKICQNERAFLKQLLALATLEPMLLASGLNKGPGYVSIRRGQVIYLMKCKSTEVRLRSTLKCYQDIPIWLGNQSMFVTPRDKIIIPIGQEVICSQLSPI